jgi:hypothetical protein
MTPDRDQAGSTDINDVLNPHRGEEQSRAREHAAEILAGRGVLLREMKPTTSWPISGLRSSISNRWWKLAAATP